MQRMGCFFRLGTAPYAGAGTKRAWIRKTLFSLRFALIWGALAALTIYEVR